MSVSTTPASNAAPYPASHFYIDGNALSRIDLDAIINSINRRRVAIQHAVDALWPASDEANHPIRKTFGIPLNRAMGL